MTQDIGALVERLEDYSDDVPDAKLAAQKLEGLQARCDRALQEAAANAEMAEEQAGLRQAAEAREAALREALEGLVRRWDLFTGPERHGWGNMEQAYYDLAKHAQKEWKAAQGCLLATAPQGGPSDYEVLERIADSTP